MCVCVCVCMCVCLITTSVCLCLCVLYSWQTLIGKKLQYYFRKYVFLPYYSVIFLWMLKMNICIFFNLHKSVYAIASCVSVLGINLQNVFYIREHFNNKTLTFFSLSLSLSLCLSFNRIRFFPSFFLSSTRFFPSTSVVFIPSTDCWLDAHTCQTFCSTHRPSPFCFFLFFFFFFLHTQLPTRVSVRKSKARCPLPGSDFIFITLAFRRLFP